MASLRQRGLGVQLALPGQAVASVGDALLGDPLPYASKGPGKRFALAPYGTAFVWAPYTAEGSFQAHGGWMSYLLTLFLMLVVNFILAWAVPTVVSYSTAAVPTVGLNAVPIALVYAAVILFGHSWRTAQNLPFHLLPGLTWAETMHTHIGLVVAIPYMVMQLAASAITAPLLNALGSTNLENYALGARPISYWQATFLTLGLQVIVIYAALQNANFKHHHLMRGENRSREKRGVHRAFKATSMFLALAVFICVVIGYGNGLWSLGNFVVTFGSQINTGGWNTPDSAAWVIPLLWWLPAGTIAWALHLLTWNVNALTEAEVQAVMEKQEQTEETSAE